MKRHRPIIIGVFIILLLLGGLWLRPKLIRTGALGTASGAIILAGLPSTLCPTHVIVVVGTEAIREQTVQLTNCRTLELSRLGVENKDATVLIKLSHALAERVVLTAETQAVSVSVRLGDVDNDNIIDALDEDLIVKELWTKSTSGSDLDSDGTVSAADLAYTRLNRGIGQEKTDGKPWGVER